MALKISGASTGSATLNAEDSGSDVELILPDHAGTIQTEVDLAAQKTLLDADILAVDNRVDLIPAKNWIINGGLQHWQRATSGTTVSPQYITADRWWINGGIYSARNPGVEGNRLVMSPTGTQSYVDMAQGIEIPTQDYFKDKSFTLSFWSYNSAQAYVPYIEIQYRDAVGTGSTNRIILESEYLSQVSSGAWHLHEFTFTITDAQLASNKCLQVRIGHYDVTGILASTDCYFHSIKLEEGDKATPFVLPEFTEEWLKCSRYYVVGSTTWALTAGTTTKVVCNLDIPCPMFGSIVLSDISYTIDGTTLGGTVLHYNTSPVCPVVTFSTWSGNARLLGWVIDKEI